MRSELFSGAIWIKADATSLRTQLLGGATLKRTFIRNRRRFLTEAGTFRKQLRAAAMSSALILSLLSGADANPTGAEIRAGQAHIAPGVNTEIQQLTDKAIIDWQSFSIGNGESVRFFQPGTQSVILNRVVGADPSQILGTLTANGNVFLINTNGILFGPNSVVSVGGLVASSLNISDDDFLQGNYTFALKEGSPLAAIINQGTIKVSDAGYAVLTSPTVINEGLIVARTGKIVLGATERTTLNLDGRDLVHYAIGSERNEGATLLSHGDVSQALLDTLGVAPNRRADQLIRNADGSVVLKNSSGTLVQAGTVETDGVGGANGGKIWLDSSDLTLLAKGSTTTASASEGNASGGEIYVLSHMDGNQTIQGFSDVQAESLLAASGSGSGDGGFIEVSGDGLNLLGEIDLSSESGVAGSFLLDPVDIVIIDGDNAPTTVANPLIFDDFTNNMSTLIGAQWFRTQPFSTLAVESSGNITVDMQLEGNNPLNNNTVDFRRGGSATTITLEAGTDPGVVGNINLGNNGTTYTGLNSFALIADGNIQLGDSIISTGGSFSATAGTGITGGTGSATTGNGNMTLEATTGDITLQNYDLTVRSSQANLDVSRELFLRTPAGSIDLGAGSASAQGSIQITAGVGVDLSNNSLDSDLRRVLSVNAGGDINLTNARLNQNLAGLASGIAIRTTGGGIDLNGSQISVGQDANDNFDLTATGLINFGNSVINVLVSNPTDGVSITTAGAIDLGTADLTFDSNFGAAPLNTLLSAGTGISGQTGSIDVDGDLTLETTTGNIALQNFDIDVRSSASNLDVSNELFIRAPGGSIDLGTGSANVVGSIQINASGNVDLSDNTLDSNLRRIISVNSGGDINLTNALINQNLGTGASGINFTTTNGGIDLNGSQISVGQDANDNFDLTATGLINFGNSVINVLVSNPTDGVSITTTGSIDLGTATINLDSNFGAIPLNTLIMAGTGISGQTGVINVDGGLTLETTTGDISLQNFDIDVRSSASNLNISNELFVTSRAGSIDLGASVVDVVGSINLRSSNNIDLGSGTLSIVTLNRDFQAFAGGTIDAASAQVTVPNRFSLGANGGVQANGSRIDAPDLEIFGFDPLATTPALDPARAVAGPVRLDLSRTGNIDISLLAEGDIEINHTGGTLTTERAGLEGSGGSASPSSIRSTTGSITIVSDGELRLGKGGGDAGEAFVKADATNAQVSLTADTITDVSNAAPIDVSSGGQLVLKGTTQVAGTTNGLEVSGRGIVLDLSAGTANEGGVNIIGNSEYLKVLANRSNVNVVETVNTGANQLRISDVAGKDELRLDPLGIATVHVVDSADIALGPISVTDGQTLAIQAINGSNITEGGTGPGNLDSAGNLLLTAEGSIGTPTESVLIPGGVVAAQAGSDAGDQLFLESRDVDLSLDTVTVTDALGTAQATASGLSAGGDIVAKVSGTNPANLLQNGNIASTAGSVVLAVESGNLEQTTGNTIRGASLGFKVSGDVGTFDGNTARPVNIDAGEVALAVGGDVILDRATGDVNLVNQVTAAGETVTTTGAGGDLRVQAQNGNVRLNTDLTSGGETALVSGTNLTVNAQTLPNSVFLNGNLTATQSLVVISTGDVVYQSGTLTSPKIGIGAAGSIGTTTEPVQIQTDNLALNPAGGQVNDPDGFTTVNSVSAAGATVNQGTTNTNNNGGGGGTTGGTTVTVTVVLDPGNVASGVFLNDGALPQALAQNNVDMVEEVLTDMLGQPTGFNYQEADPTRPPNKGWFNDEDLLKRKFRR